MVQTYYVYDSKLKPWKASQVIIVGLLHLQMCRYITN